MTVKATQQETGLKVKINFTYIHTYIHAYTHTYIYIERETDRQTDRQERDEEEEKKKKSELKNRCQINIHSSTCIQFPFLCGRLLLTHANNNVSV